jgi:glycosyltransferase involved in cell wall biosynthesis|tara:strand:+ start:1075 stop:1251 length:177 start_codon:yes stop_codon:yes gene_type:complete
LEETQKKLAAWAKKIISFYDKCNIFVLLSYTEGAPKVIFESLAQHRPIIVFEEIKHVK